MSKLKKLNKLNKSKTLSVALSVGLVAANLVNVVPAFAVGSANSAIMSSSTRTSLSITNASFDKNAPCDVTVVFTPVNGYTFNGIKYGSKTLVKGTDYTLDTATNTVTILKDYLLKQSAGTKSLKFDFNNGTDPILRVSVKDNRPTVSMSSSTFDANHPKDITATISLKGNTFLNLNGLQPGSNTYEVTGSSSSKRVKIHKEYLLTLGNGPKDLQFNFVGKDPVKKSITVKNSGVVDSKLDSLIVSTDKVNDTIVAKFDKAVTATTGLVLTQTVDGAVKNPAYTFTLAADGLSATAKVPSVVATTVADQTVVYSVSYKGDTKTGTIIVAKKDAALTVSSVSAVNSTTVLVKFSNNTTATVYLTTPLVDGATKVTFVYNGITYADQTLDAPYHGTNDLTVTNVIAVNATTINVTFSDGVTSQYTVDTLQNGSNTRNVLYKGVTFSVTVSFAAPTSGARVENIQLNNYRQFVVTFNTAVDKASAENLNNYYFEMIEGNAGEKLGSTPVVDGALTLATIDAAAKADELHAPLFPKVEISSAVVGGKTVVTINLPENERFANTWDYGNSLQDGDDEQSILLRLADGTTKDLIKNTDVAFSVRNVLTLDKKYAINTSVDVKRIIDEVSPGLQLDAAASRKATVEGVLQDVTVSKAALDASVANAQSNAIPIENTLPCDGSEMFTVNFNEPVFDAHDTLSTVKVYVNNELVAETGKSAATVNAKGAMPNSFSTISHFAQADHDSYAAAEKLGLDLYSAVQNYDAVTGNSGAAAFWKINKVYDVKVVGVTDLAGNVQTPSTVDFTFKLIEKPANGNVITNVPPKVLDIKQVADNVVRVYTDQNNVNFNLVMDNADGDNNAMTVKVTTPSAIKVDENGDGKIDAKDNVWATDVYFNAEDSEAAPTKGILQYDGQNYVRRSITINNVVNTVTTLAGNSLVKDNFTLYKDMLAPQINQANIYLAGTTPVTNLSTYQQLKETDTIRIDLKDLVPTQWQGKYGDAPLSLGNVAPLKYDFTASNEFSNTIKNDTGDFLPIRISYVENGITHEQLVSNKAALLNNPGIANSITYDIAHDQLVIDLNPGNDANLTDGGSAYLHLLNDQGKLVEGKTYKVEIPKGYFADSDKDIAPMIDETIAPSIMGQYFIDGVSATKDVLHVDNGRTAGALGYGFVTNAADVTFTVPVSGANGGSDYAGVPQTSKELISYDQAKNQIKVIYTGKLDAATVINPANYKLNGSVMPADTKIDFVIDNKGTLSNLLDDVQYALITVPQNTVPANGYVLFEAGYEVNGVRHAVANPDGGMAVPVGIKLNLLDNTQPVLMQAAVSGEKEISMVFDEPVQATAGVTGVQMAENFQVFVGNEENTVDNVIILGNKVTLQVHKSIADNATVTMKIVKDQNGNILLNDLSTNRNQIRVGTYTVSN